MGSPLPQPPPPGVECVMGDGTQWGGMAMGGDLLPLGADEGGAVLEVRAVHLAVPEHVHQRVDVALRREVHPGEGSIGARGTGGDSLRPSL